MRRGFSIVEVLLAAVLIGFGVLALVGVQIYSLKVGKGTSGRYTASLLASSILNECEARLKDGFSTPVDQARGPAPDHPGYEFEVTSLPEGLYLKRVEVKVYWKDAEGEARQYVLWTKVTP